MASTPILYVIFSLVFTTVLAESISDEARKLPFEVLLFHSSFGVAAVLVIIKIVLAIAFVGTLTTLFHAFAGIKHLLTVKGLHHESEPFFAHDHFHDYHFDEPPPFYKTQAPEAQEPSYPVALKRTQQSFEGGRYIRSPIPIIDTRINYHKIKKRSADHMENSPLKRITRSTNTNENCKREAICKLHARALNNPLYAYELYFIRKKGLAKYWDHQERTYKECEKKYPCNKQLESESSSLKNTDKNVHITHENNNEIIIYSDEDYSPDY